MINLHKVRVSPSVLSGNVCVPPSKSAAHRAIICASLAAGKSRISPVEMSEDMKATINCMRALGADITVCNGFLEIDGSNVFSVKNADLDCRESGSTLRFLIPVAAAGGVNATFTGKGKLPQRPIDVLTDRLPQHGTECVTNGGLPLEINGKLKSGVYEIPGNISSQFITGLLLALPLCEGDSEIKLTTDVQSAGYIDMTIAVMKEFGVNVESTENGWIVRGGSSYTARSFTVEGDWSQAAFFMTAGALGGKVTITNLLPDSTQGDKACVDIYRRFGADIKEENGSITISGGMLHGIEIDARDIPDMVPALAVTASLAEGTTIIKGAERLRIKECDRLFAMAQGLSRLGADIRETPDGLIIKGVRRLRGTELEGFNDHRIVMSLSTAAARCDGDIIISDMESINKSYPSYFEDYRALGGIADVIMG